MRFPPSPGTASRGRPHQTGTVRHFYHVYAGAPWWNLPLREHARAFRAAGLTAPVTCGVNGEPQDTAQVLDWLAREWPETEAVTGPPGNEDHTLRLAWRWARAHPGGAVLYAHAKGSSDPSFLNQAWRESMTEDVVIRWRDCLKLLEEGYDACGPHWLDPAAVPNMTTAAQAYGGSRTPYFGGNFWWAAADYLTRLDEPDPGGTRWDAERWVGTAHPEVADLRPGWPNMMIFDSPVARRVLTGSEAFS